MQHQQVKKTKRSISGKRRPCKASLVYVSSGGHFVQPSITIFAILVKRQKEEHFYEVIWEYCQRPRRRCRFLKKKFFSFFFFFFFKLWLPFYSGKQTHFSNYSIGAYEKHFCEIILKSGHLHRRSSMLKFFFSLFSIFSYGGHFFHPLRTILAFFFVGRRKRNILFEAPAGKKKGPTKNQLVKKTVQSFSCLFSALSAILISRLEPFLQFW